jgi:hypothetical protein
MPFLVVKPEASSQAWNGGSACRFDWWLGDDLVGSPPVFLVTARLKDALLALEPPVGFVFEPIRAEASAFFRESSPGRELPEFWRWRVAGRAGVDDAGLLHGHELVVSGRVLAALLSGRLEQAEILQFRESSAGGRLSGSG